MASALFDSTRNFSFYSIPAAWICCAAPHFYAISKSKTFDNRSPRGYVAGLEKDQTIDSATKGKITRAESAQQNGFENIGLFAAAVVAGNIAGLPASTLNTFSFGYIASRAVYNILYINNTTDGAATMRSMVFLAGIAQIFTLFVKSGNVLRESAANLL